MAWHFGHHFEYDPFVGLDTVDEDVGHVAAG